MVSEQVGLGILIPPEIHCSRRRRRPPLAVRRRIRALRAANNPFCSRPSRLACRSGRRRPVFRVIPRPCPAPVRAGPCSRPAPVCAAPPSAPPPAAVCGRRRLRASLHARLRPSAVVAASALVPPGSALLVLLRLCSALLVFCSKKKGCSAVVTDSFLPSVVWVTSSSSFHHGTDQYNSNQYHS